MPILRKDNKAKYTNIDMSIIKDTRLSLKALGLFVKMLSLPDYWEFSENGLIKILNDGQTSIRTGLKELEELGYLTRNQLRNSNGTIKEVEWNLYETPQLENQSMDNQSMDFPSLDIRPQYNTNISNIKELNNKGLNMNIYNTRTHDSSNQTNTPNIGQCHKNVPTHIINSSSNSNLLFYKDLIDIIKPICPEIVSRQQRLIDKGNISDIGQIEDYLTSSNQPKEFYIELFTHFNKTYMVKPKFEKLNIWWALNSVEKIKNTPIETYDDFTATIEKKATEIKFDPEKIKKFQI